MTRTVAWNPNPETDVAGYTVYLGTISGNYPTTQTATSTSTVFSGLTPSTTYYCAVRAYNSSGLTSELSSEISFTTAAAAAPEIAISDSAGTAMASGAGTVAFGSTTTGTSSRLETLTISNLGNASLTGLAVSLAGADASSFSTTTDLPSSAIVSTNGGFENGLNSWTQTTGHLRSTTSAAASQGTSIVVFNDGDTPPDGTLSQCLPTTPGTTYTLAFDVGVVAYNGNPQSLQATVRGAATLLSKTVTVTGITNGVTRWLPQSYTFTADSPTTTLTFTDTSAFTNSIDLLLDNVSVTGPATGTASLTSLAPGLSACVAVTFKPLSAGTKTATLQVFSNDADEPAFAIGLTGTGASIVTDKPLPQIAVQHAGGADLTSGSANIAFGATNSGVSASPQSFTIHNPGMADLSGLAVTVDGSQASDFIASSPAANTLAPGAVTDFTVTFKPCAAGLRTATLHIASNAVAMPSFDVALTGTGIALPEITVEKSDGTNLTDGGSGVTFGALTPGADGIPRSFTIRNTGTADLSGLAVATNGAHAGDFAVSASGVTTLAPGATTVFTVTFKPNAAGVRTAAVQITSNDADESPFEIPLTGTGLAMQTIATPEIDVTHADNSPLAGGGTPEGFGRVKPGLSGTTVGFTIHNRGTADLTGLSLAAIGKNASDFALQSLQTTTLAPGAATTFHVTFQPKTAGNKTAAIRIHSNDADENSFDIALSGTGIALPEIEVAIAGEGPLTDGAGVANFGKTVTRSSGAVKTFVIRNTGTATLTGLKATRSGGQSSDFIIAAPAQTNLAPGAKTTFKVSFHPGAAGMRGSTLHITSNDTDEGRFDVAMAGVGIAVPDIEVRVAGARPLTDDKAFINFGPAKGTTRTFTITNRGDAKLTGLTLRENGIHAADFTASPLTATSLKPGKSTSFKVTFDPQAKGIRWAAIHIGGNDPDTASFDIVLTGGRAPSSAKSAAIRNIASTTAGTLLKPAETRTSPVVSVVLIDGQNHRCITIPKTAGTPVDPRAVEVSANLVDWSSGADHTTVIRNNASLLQVRDNTPLTPGTKRFIRLKQHR